MKIIIVLLTDENHHQLQPHWAVLSHVSAPQILLFILTLCSLSRLFSLLWFRINFRKHSFVGLQVKKKMSRHPKYGPRCSEFNNTSTCKLLNRCSPGFVTLHREGTPESTSWRIKRVTDCSGITSCFLERMFVCVPLAPRPVARVSQRLRFQRHSERLSGWQPGRETSSGALRARMCACVCVTTSLVFSSSDQLNWEQEAFGNRLVCRRSEHTRKNQNRIAQLNIRCLFFTALMKSRDGLISVALFHYLCC